MAARTGSLQVNVVNVVRINHLISNFVFCILLDLQTHSTKLLFAFAICGTPSLISQQRALKPLNWNLCLSTGQCLDDPVVSLRYQIFASPALNAETIRLSGEI